MPHETGPGTTHVVVVGGGIAGLAAAHAIGTSAPGVRVTVLEAGAVVGGKLAVTDVAGVPVDVGAESMLARRPEGVELVRAVGLADRLAHPRTTTAYLWTRGRLRPLPGGTVLGVPGDLRALARARVLSIRGLARLPLDHVLPARPLRGDVSVARYVCARLGQEVVDRLVDPLLAGVYAGRADRLSWRATMPALAAAARDGRSLIDAAATVRSAQAVEPPAAAATHADAAAPVGGAAPVPADPRHDRTGPVPAPVPAPVFAGLTGGLGLLPRAVAAASGAAVRTRATVRAVQRDGAGYLVVVGPAAAPEAVHADAVVLAVPAPAAARLLEGLSPTAALDLEQVAYASVAIVTLAYARRALPDRVQGSGLLVPAVDGRALKAATFSGLKWGWVADAAPGLAVVRGSVGRHREELVLHRDDADLARLVADDLREAVGLAGRPVAAHVRRWGGALPQYAVGHLDRVARVRAAVAALPGLAVCGAAYDGVGIAACVSSGQLAATQVLDHLATRTRSSGASMDA